MVRPMKQTIASGEVISPKSRGIPSPGTTILAPLKPMKAINRPIPTEMACFTLFGIPFTIASRTLVNVNKMKIRPSINTAVKANC